MVLVCVFGAGGAPLFAQEAPGSPQVPPAPQEPPLAGPEGKPFAPFAPAPEMGAQSVEPAAVPLGQPGLSFRYVQTFGVAETPYISTTTHLNYPYGVGAQGNSIWIGELMGRRALKYDADGGNLAVIGRAGWVDNPGFAIQSVFDVAADSSGNIWVVDGQAHHVLQFDPAGNLVKELGHAWQEGSANDRFGSPNSIAFDSQGNIYVSDGSDWWTGDVGNQRIQVFNPDGSYKYTLGTTGSSGTGNYQFHGPAHIAIYNDSLYVADRGNHRVQVYQISFSPAFAVTYVATMGQTGVAGSDNAHFNNPSGVAVDASYIYVADTFNHRVQVFNRTTRQYVATIGTYGSANGQFDQPYDVAVGGSGYLYVADFWNSRVQQFSYAGGTAWNWRRTYGVTGVPYVTDNAHFFHPQGVAVAADGSIYVAENYGRRLVKLAADGTPQWSTPDVPGVLGYSPNDVTIGKDGRIYLAAGWENRIRIYNPDGTLYSSFGGYGNGPYEFDDPQGIGVAPNGDIYVADCWNHRVQIYGPDWAYKATLGVNGQSGNDNAHFNGPRDVAVDANGTIYVADAGNDRVQVFDSNRNYVRTIGGGGTGSDFGHFDGWGPPRLAVDGQNRLYVADADNNRIQIFDSSGAYLTTIGGSWGNLTGQLRGPHGVAVDADGNVYIADTNNHRIQKFAPGVPGWRQVNINGFGERANSNIHTLAVFGGQLYAGTYNGNGAQLWRMDTAGNWTRLTVGFGITRNIGINHLAIFNGQLYAGVRNDQDGAQMYRSNDGNAWEPVVTSGFGDPLNTGVYRLVAFDGQLYAGTSSWTVGHGSEIWRSSSGDNGTWERVVSGGFDNPNNYIMRISEVHNGYLYFGTQNIDTSDYMTTTGGIIIRSNTGDSGSWVKVTPDGFGDVNNYVISGLASFNGYLYASTSRWSWSGIQVWRCQVCDGSDWEKVVDDGFGNRDNVGLSTLQVFDGNLYLVTGNWREGIEIWRTTTGNPGEWSQISKGGLGDSNNNSPYYNNVTVFNNRLYLGTQNGANGGEVWEKTVIADFTASPTAGSPGTTVTFTNLSGGDVREAVWDFGDGSPPVQSNASTVQHTYERPGLYTVSLRVSDGVDTDTRTRPGYIHIAHRLFLPQITREYNPLMALYEDFNNPAFDGFYNPLKWQFWGDSNYFTMRQQGGVMQITNTPGTPAGFGLDLPLAMPLERTLRQVQRFQARLKLGSGTSGTGVHIHISAPDGTINGHGWWTQCSLTAYGSSPGFGCDVTTYVGSTYTQEYGVGWPGSLAFDTWYTARIEINPDTAQVCFYLDNNLLGCHVPNDAAALKTATNLVPRIGSWNGNPNAIGTRYFDDVYITPAR
jgi:PKD repeat protein/sugar lactone lactonase YvrE